MRSAEPDELRILFWNCKVGRPGSVIRAALLLLTSLTWPHAIALQEAKRFSGTLPGYTRCAARPDLRPDAENIVILVRTGLLGAHGPIVVRNPEGWTHDKPKPARTFYAAHVLWLWLVSVHMCTKGREENREEWAAEFGSLLDFAREVDGPLAMVGDWNRTARNMDWLAPQVLAERIGGRVEADDPEDIDYALMRGARGWIRRLLSRHGSDHWPRLLTVRRVGRHLP